MAHPMYQFSFAQTVWVPEFGRKVIRNHISAPDHLTAFQAWCALPAIQNIPMDQLGELVVSVVPSRNNE